MKQAEVFDETESPIPLASVADVERMLAKVIRQVHKGTLTPQLGHSLIIGLGTLARIKEARIERIWAKRAEVLWAERQARLTDASGPQAHN